MTGTKGQLGTKDLGPGLVARLAETLQLVLGPNFELSANRLKPCWHKLQVPIHVVESRISNSAGAKPVIPSKI